MVADWWAARLTGDTAVMVASRRSDVDDLNARARARMIRAGKLDGPELVVDDRPYQRGDEIMCRKNAYRLGVLNGTRGHITGLDPDARTLTLATHEGATVTLPSWYLDAGHVAHAYATTVHKAQGSTVERAFVLGTDALYREMGYTAMSRGRDSNHLYVVGGQAPDPDDHHATPRPPKPDEEMLVALEKSRGKHLAIDALRGGTAARLAALHAEQRRLTPVVANTPPDPSRERGALTEARRRALARLEAARAEKAEARGIRRSSSARRAWAEARIRQARARLTDIDRALAALHDRELEHREYLAAYAEDLERAETVDAAITRTHRERLDEVTALPPPYLVSALGPLPQEPPGREIWRDAASRIERYRAEAGVTDDHDPLGPPPDDALRRHRWREVARHAKGTRSRLERPERPMRRDDKGRQLRR